MKKMATTAEALLKEVSENMAKMAEFLVKMQTEMPGRGGGGGRRSLDVRNIAVKNSMVRWRTGLPDTPAKPRK